MLWATTETFSLLSCTLQRSENADIQPKLKSIKPFKFQFNSLTTTTATVLRKRLLEQKYLRNNHHFML